MGKPTGFLEIQRQDKGYAPVAERLKHYDEFSINLEVDAVSDQGARCMDCGIPYCHDGCPINNIIPDWNDLVYRGDWQQAISVLHSTNNFPEFTGRVCPAPCEAACTLNLTEQPVTIKTIEYNIIEKAWSEGWIKPEIAPKRSGKSVAVVGSGPAGMACAQQLARAGHSVTLYEKNDRIGGLLRYGIPDFKLGKKTIDRRMSQMQAEGVQFRPNTEVGSEALPFAQLQKCHDAIVLTGGSEDPRDLPIEGRDLDGIHFAMDFLRQQNKRVAGDSIPESEALSATDKHVVVIGGGDTGSDCIGTSIRQGAAKVTQLEIMPKPPEQEDKGMTWPNWPIKMRTSTSQEEGCDRDWSVMTTSATGENGQVSQLNFVRLDEKMQKIEGSEFSLKADLVLLAMGFVNPVFEGMLAQSGVELDGRKNVLASTEGADAYKTSAENVFAAGDMRRGQSLVVWAIREGRQAARAVDEFLMGSSELPR